MIIKTPLTIAKNSLAFFLLQLSHINYGQTAKPDEQLIFDRINYVYQLKAAVARDSWRAFGYKEYDIPLIYFTETSSYVANPTSRFLSMLRPELVFENKTVKIYQTHPRVDTIAHHMATLYQTTDSLRQYNYKSPFMNCSSPEITHANNPAILCTEQWAAKALHEYFHGFQYKHRAMVDYATRNFLYIAGDGFKKFYSQNAWFKEKVDKENELLLQAIAEPNDSISGKIVRDFLMIRAARRKTTKEKLNFNIEKYEKYYETLEGTGRYVEYSIFGLLAIVEPDSALKKSDPFYHSNAQFKNYNVGKDEWLYLTTKSTYINAIGFNMARLLDKLKVDYKDTFFTGGNYSLEDLLVNAVTVKKEAEVKIE